MIKVSVIIPVYNAEKFISECLKSVLNQSLKEIEVVCIDDGSTDNSAKIIREYQMLDNRVKLYYQKNSGSGSARNNAIINHACGEFIAFMDSDDWYPETNNLEILYTKAKANDVKIVGGSFVRYYSDGRVESEFKGVYKAYKFEKEEIIDYRDYQFDYGYHRFIYNLDMLKQNSILFPDYRRFQDPPFFVKAMLASKRFYALTIPVYAYRKGHQTINWDVQKLIGLIQGLQEDLMISRRNKLENLHGMTVMRLEKEFSNLFLKYLDKSCNLGLEVALKRFYSTIDYELLNKSNFPFDQKNSNFIGKFI